MLHDFNILSIKQRNITCQKTYLVAQSVAWKGTMLLQLSYEHTNTDSVRLT